MRRNPTPAESVLAFTCGILGLRVLKQNVVGNAIIGHRIIDVFLPDYQIGLEADGAQHYTPEGIAADRKRSQFFSVNFPAFRFLRYSNHEILRVPGFKDRLQAEIMKAASLDTWPHPITTVGAVEPCAVVASKPPLAVDVAASRPTLTA